MTLGGLNKPFFYKDTFHFELFLSKSYFIAFDYLHNATSFLTLYFSWIERIIVSCDLHQDPIRAINWSQLHKNSSITIVNTTQYLWFNFVLKGVGIDPIQIEANSLERFWCIHAATKTSLHYICCYWWSLSYSFSLSNCYLSWDLFTFAGKEMHSILSLPFSSRTSLFKFCFHYF